MSRLGNAIIAIVAIAVVAIFVPSGLATLYAANTAGWDTSALSIQWYLMPLLLTIGSLFFVIMALIRR